MFVKFTKDWKFAEKGFIIHAFKADVEYSPEDLPKGCLKSAIGSDIIDDESKEAAKEAMVRIMDLETAADTKDAAERSAPAKAKAKKDAANKPHLKRGAPPKKTPAKPKTK